MSFVWKHPKYYKKPKKNLTNENFSDKGDDHEKIQSKNIRTRDRRNSNNTIRQRTNTRDTRK